MVSLRQQRARIAHATWKNFQCTTMPSATQTQPRSISLSYSLFWKKDRHDQPIAAIRDCHAGPDRIATAYYLQHSTVDSHG